MSVRNNGVKDGSQTWIDHLVYENDSKFSDIAANARSMRQRIDKHLNDLHGMKLEAIATTALGATVGISGVMLGALPMAIVGFGVLAAGGFSTSGRGKDLTFAAKESQFLRLNRHVLDVLAQIEVQGVATPELLADVYNELFALSCYGDDVLRVEPQQIQQVLAQQANGYIGGFAGADQYSQAMTTGAPIALPEPVQFETVEPEYVPEVPRTAFRPAFHAAQPSTVNPVSQPERVQVEAFTQPPKFDAAAALWDIVDRDESFFIVGSKGSGKGMFTANLLRRKLAQYPNAIALVLDPKGDKKEDGYWDHPQIQRHSFVGMRSDSQTWEEETTAFLAKAAHTISQADIRNGKRVWVIFDEFLGLRTNLSKPLFAEVSKMCSNNISMGDSTGVHAIAITVSFNSGDAGWSDELVKNMCLVGLFRQDEYDRAKKIVKFGRANADAITVGEFGGLIQKSDINRVMCVGGQFLPTPRLTNYSGFDRDSGKEIKSAPKATTDPEPEGLREIANRVINARNSLSQSDFSAEEWALFQQNKKLAGNAYQARLARLAMHYLCAPPFAHSPNQFCNRLGVSGGTSYTKLIEAYNWAMSCSDELTTVNR